MENVSRFGTVSGVFLRDSPDDDGTGTDISHHQLLDVKVIAEKPSVAFAWCLGFEHEFALEAVIRSHACSREARMRVTNDHSSRESTALTASRVYKLGRN
jgi:hypothetical protein